MAAAKKKKSDGKADGKAAKATVTPHTVLVVDDYADAREMYCEYLEFSGFRTDQAKNGVEALDKAFTHPPDIILMDLSLPTMDGWEATRRLKADARTRHIPVVALTGHALAGFSEGAKQAGCDAFITKPCLPDDLVAAVKQILEGPNSSSGGGSKKAARAKGR